MSFGGRKFSINRHTGAPKTLARRFSMGEPSTNGTLACLVLSLIVGVAFRRLFPPHESFPSLVKLPFCPSKPFWPT